MNSSDALKKINSNIQFTLSYIIREEFPEYLISLTDVDTSPDLEHAKILVGVPGDDHKVVKELNLHAPGIRKLLAHSDLKIRRVPKLRFLLDESSSNFQNIDRLLKDI